jgi:hypothetical protein
MSNEDYQYGFEDGLADAKKGRLLALGEVPGDDYAEGYRDGAAEAGTDAPATAKSEEWQ